MAKFPWKKKATALALSLGFDFGGKIDYLRLKNNILDSRVRGWSPQAEIGSGNRLINFERIRLKFVVSTWRHGFLFGFGIRIANSL